MNHSQLKGRAARLVRLAKLAEEGRVPGGSKSQEVLGNLGFVNGHKPKNEPAYAEIAGAIPGFGHTVSINEAHHGQVLVHFDGYPNVDRHAPSLADLVRYARGEIRLKFDAFPRATQKHVQVLCDLGPVGEAFARLLVSLPVSFPPPEVMSALANWLKRAIAGEESTVFSGVCPDYAVDPATGRYTFSSLNSGVGLVAKRVQRAIPGFAVFCRQNRLNVRFVAAIGDFEADSEETCRRVGLTREQFRERLRESQEAFRSGVSPEVPLDTPFASDIGDWYGTLEACRAEVAAGRISGPYNLTEADLAQILDGRRSLYERWYGEGCDAKGILLRQSPEYGAMGTLATSAFPNTLILGGDAPVMGIFWQQLAKSLRPVIYLRGVDY